MKLPAHKKMLSAAAAASVLLLTAACGTSDEASEPSSSTSAPATDDSNDTAETSGTYADGDYEAEGSYSNPGGESTVKVAVTLGDGGTISDITVTPEATNGTSKQYQSQFAGGISDEVVGKSLDDIDVSKVAGSSLTSTGFNQAIEEIKAEAQA